MRSGRDTTERAAPRTLALAMILAALAAALLSFLFLTGPRQGLEARHALLVRKVRLASDMRADLYAAAEAEKSAVLADTDQASGAFAEAARTAAGRVAANLELLRQAAGSDGADAAEEAGLRDFATAFDEYRKVDEEVLDLAVQNTNLKALALSFGEAQRALADMERALAPLADEAPAQRALAEALRIQALHAPHIMEKTEARMDELERGMAGAARAARAALARLPEGPGRAGAIAAFERHARVTAEVVRLSRRNTNVRSLALSLERKTRVLAACAEALRVLEDHLRQRQDTRATR